MKLKLSKVKQTLTTIYSKTGASVDNVNRLVDMALDHDLRSNTFSGLTQIEWDTGELTESLTKNYELVVDKSSMKLINGNGRSARLISKDMVEMVVKMAKETGIGMVSLYNSTYHSTLEYNAREIAAHDLVAILSANGGPIGVTPFNGTKAITGTNPLAYAIPSNDFPIVFDAATALYPWGSIRLARERGKTLPENAYFDKDGSYTTDPHQAVGIIHFGGHKGSAINMMLEILTGALVRAKMGFQVKGESDLGSFFIAIDPAAYQPIDEFKTQVSHFIDEVHSIKAVSGSDAVRLPGMRSELARQKMIDEDYIEVDEVTFKKYQESVEKYT